MRKLFWKPRRIVGGLLGPVVLLAVLPVPANAYPRPGLTERVSVASDGTQGNLLSVAPAISPDARYVAFASEAPNLVPGDTNGSMDVFVHDRETGTTERVSVSSDGTQGVADSTASAISADARYVAFASEAPNLVPGDTNGARDVFVHDRETGTTERVSVSSVGAQSDADTTRSIVALSADGRYVAFQSGASNLVPGDTNEAFDVFVRDRDTGTTARASVGSDGAQSNDSSFAPAISPDARYVAFASDASNLVPGGTDGSRNVFVRDRETGTTELVSVAPDGAEGSGDSDSPAISPDGRFVAFHSLASNLVPWDFNGLKDVFVRDRGMGTTERVSVASDGTPANGGNYEPPPGSIEPAISADGRYVAFWTHGTNLVSGGDTNVGLDVFVHDRATGTTERVSVASDESQSSDGGGSYRPTISADGRFVAFVSGATNLVPGDTNGTRDVFVRERGGPLNLVGTPSVVKVPAGLTVTGRATFSGAVIAGAADPGDDGGGVGPVGATDVGAELRGAALVYRPEPEDLLLRLNVSSLPPGWGDSPPGLAGLPAVVYGADLQVGETRYEVRALRAAATGGPPPIDGTTSTRITSIAAFAALYRCAPVCTQQIPLAGSIGTTGEQVLVSVPLSALGASEGTELSELRAFTALGEAAVGSLVPLDEAPLSSSVIPAARVELGIAPASTPEDQVAFTVEAGPLAGEFSGTIPRDGIPPGSYRVWARACLGDDCGATVSGGVAL